MATVKITCPQCLGFGLTGVASASTCSQCSGRGTVSIDDSQSLATINTAQASAGTAMVVAAAVAAPTIARKVSARGNGENGGHQ